MTAATQSHAADCVRYPTNPTRNTHHQPQPAAVGAGAAGDMVSRVGKDGLGGNSIASIAMEHCSGMNVAMGVVVEFLDAQIGTWQCSMDEGATWRTIRTDLINRPGHMGLALDRTARLRVLPIGGGPRNPAARVVFHATERPPGEGNGSYRPYPPDDRGNASHSVTLMLTLATINGMPPDVPVPRLRNKRALAAQRSAAAVLEVIG